MKFRISAACIAFTAIALPLSAHAETAVLRGLDKTTGIAKDFSAPVGKVVKFGTLEITARGCSKRAPEETPEVSAFLEITDDPVVAADQQKPGKAKIFSGWMFASSPALNALEHPSYDVWVIDCKS